MIDNLDSTFLVYLKNYEGDLEKIKYIDKLEITKEIFKKYRYNVIHYHFDNLYQQVSSILSFIDKEKYLFLFNEFMEIKPGKWWLDYYSHSTYHRFKKKIVNEFFYYIFGF